MQPHSTNDGRDGRQAPRDPSIVDALLRVFESGQRIVLDRVDLARYDLAQLAAGALRGTALIAGGAVLVASAWFTLMAGVVVWAHQSLSLVASLALVGGINGLLGVLAIMAGVERARPDVRFDELLGSPTDGAVGSSVGPGNGHDRREDAE
ncbi:MAG: phage holin family protein [Candidatus Binatia bacterium]